MYENKVLVNIYILSLNKNCEIFIPINERVGNISKLLNSILIDSIDYSKSIILMNADNGKCYKNNEIIRDTDIKNGSKLVLL